MTIQNIFHSCPTSREPHACCSYTHSANNSHHPPQLLCLQGSPEHAVTLPTTRTTRSIPHSWPTYRAAAYILQLSLQHGQNTSSTACLHKVRPFMLYPYLLLQQLTPSSTTVVPPGHPHTCCDHAYNTDNSQHPSQLFYIQGSPIDVIAVHTTRTEHIFHDCSTYRAVPYMLKLFL